MSFDYLHTNEIEAGQEESHLLNVIYIICMFMENIYISNENAQIT